MIPIFQPKMSPNSGFTDNGSAAEGMHPARNGEIMKASLSRLAAAVEQFRWANCGMDCLDR